LRWDRHGCCQCRRLEWSSCHYKKNIEQINIRWSTKWYVPGSRIADDGDIGTGQTDESVDVLNDDADRLKDAGGSGIAGGNNALAANVAGGGRWAFVALRDRDGDTADGDELGVRVVLAINFSLGAAASSWITDDGDISACKTNERVDVLDDDANRLQDSSSSGVAGGGGTLAADIPGGGGRAVATSRCGDRKSGEGKSNKGRKLHPCLKLRARSILGEIRLVRWGIRDTYTSFYIF
jgi:hypothetical protein